jgi:imidazole glycerol-phosphate synthase subunit HisF
MLKVRIIPCLDVKAGRVVKGVQFVDLIDAGDPVEAAKAYDAAGADELCFLDIRASHEDRSTLLDLVRRTAEACFMPLTVGGGVRTVEDVVTLLASGADKVLINTAAHADRSLITRAAEKVGAQAIVVNIDATRVDSPNAAPCWQVFSHVGHRALAIDALAYAEEVALLGAGEILVTSKDRDGTRAGYDVELIRAIADRVGVPVVASGGAGTLEHLVDGVRSGHASAVLAASMFHFGTVTIGAVKRHMAKAGIPVRLDGVA